jgi:GT2 family glycosyltransferase
MNPPAVAPLRVSAPRLSGPRLRRRSDTPTITIVVASNRPRALLDSCLASLRPQCERVAAELIVARSGSVAELAELRASMPDVRFIAAPPSATIPQLRGLGMGESTGDIVAVTEDHCVADGTWVETLLGHAHDPADVLGGGMGNAQRGRAVDWAAYFAEYGFFAETRAERPNDDRPLITGANVAYKRRVVDDVASWAKKGEWENVAHNRLFARGSAMRFIRSAAVYQNKNYRFTEFCVDRYQHGRDFARKRLVEEPGSRRWLLLLASPMLPPLLVWRVARGAASERWTTFLRALPVTFAFLTAWSVGEAVGYLRGAVTRQSTEATP